MSPRVRVVGIEHEIFLNFDLEAICNGKSIYYFIENGKIKEGQEDTFSTIDYNEYMDVPHVSSTSSFTAGTANDVVGGNTLIDCYHVAENVFITI